MTCGMGGDFWRGQQHYVATCQGTGARHGTCHEASTCGALGHMPFHLGAPCQGPHPCHAGLSLGSSIGLSLGCGGPLQDEAGLELGTPLDSNKKMKHNVAERRRTSRLNSLYEELDGLFASRPDLFGDTEQRHSKADVLINSVSCVRSLFTSIDQLKLHLSLALHPPNHRSSFVSSITAPVLADPATGGAGTGACAGVSNLPQSNVLPPDSSNALSLPMVDVTAACDAQEASAAASSTSLSLMPPPRPRPRSPPIAATPAHAVGVQSCDALPLPAAAVVAVSAAPAFESGVAAARAIDARAIAGQAADAAGSAALEPSSFEASPNGGARTV